jgi:3'-phosphoadenosine 5'-phosphosulfate sulfotransferase (PAPS reductase)/FAD synthetase
MNRRLVFLRLGELYKKKSGLWHCLPLAIWTNKDIFEYAKINKIEMNPIYKKMDRNGCMFCTGFKNWKQVMAKYNKKLYAKILSEKEGQQVIIKDCNF